MAVTHLHHQQQQQQHPSLSPPSDASQFSFLWFDAAKHSAAAASLLPLFGLLPSNLPTVVALSPVKGRAAVMADEWGPQAVEAFLSGLLAGTVRTFHLPADRLPSFGANTAAAAAAAGSDAAGGGASVGGEEEVVEEVSHWTG